MDGRPALAMGTGTDVSDEEEVRCAPDLARRSDAAGSGDGGNLDPRRRSALRCMRLDLATGLGTGTSGLGNGLAGGLVVFFVF
jgi:hypothetical protein